MRVIQRLRHWVIEGVIDWGKHWWRDWFSQPDEIDWSRDGLMDGLMRMPAPSNEREERAASDGHGYDALSEWRDKADIEALIQFEVVFWIKKFQDSIWFSKLRSLTRKAFPPSTNPSYKKDVPQIPLYAFPNTARIPHLHIPVSTHYPIQFNPHPAITRFQFHMQYAFWTLSIRIQLKPHLPYSIWRSNGHNTQYVFLGRPLSKLLIREIHFMWNTTKPYSSG
jgi:hypothetical protein